MALPNPDEYLVALQNLQHSVEDEELRIGELAQTALGLPMLWSGGFADVYRVHCPETGNTWAVKCFTREVAARQERYQQIAGHLGQVRLPFTTEFKYLERGVLAAGAWHPIVKMRWVEGYLLNAFVEGHLEQPRRLRQFLNLWVKMADRLREAGMAHADLQHGNVLLVPMGDDQLALRLIDYDGIFIPSLAHVRSGESGHPAYQHPQRLQQGAYSADVDRFPLLVVFSAIHAIVTEGPQLWERFNNGDNLLFREPDFCEPGGSELLRTLWNSNNQGTRTLAGRLVLAATNSLEKTPLLGEVIRRGALAPLHARETDLIDTLLAPRDSGAGIRVIQEPSDLDESVAAIDGPPQRRTEESVAGSAVGSGSANAEEGASVAAAAMTETQAASDQGTWATLRTVSEYVRSGIQWLLEVTVDGVRLVDSSLARMVGEEKVLIRRLLWGGLLTLFIAAGWLGASVFVGGISSSVTPADNAASEQEIAVDLGGGVMLEMVRIPDGWFAVPPLPSGTSVCPDAYRPQIVAISRPFYMGKYEVTQQQWEAVMGSNPSKFPGPNNPVNCISWSQSQEFARRLNEKVQDSRRVFHIPTDIEWEYACYADAKKDHDYSGAILRKHAWIETNSERSLHPVGQKEPNGWGLYDMLGNVEEACTWWAETEGAAGMDLAQKKSARSPCALLGGHFRTYNWSHLHGSAREAVMPRTPEVSHGLRVAMSVGPEASEPVALYIAPLELQPIDVQQVAPGRSVSLTVLPHKPELWRGRVRYAILPGAPSGATIDAETGMFTWSPPTNQSAGTYGVTVSAEGEGDQHSQTRFAIQFPGPPPDSQPDAFKVRAFELGDGVTLEMVLIPAGEFLMGAPDSDSHARPREKPQHRVRIDKPFYLGKYEVTEQQWVALMGDEALRRTRLGPNGPVCGVSWKESQTFLKKLNRVAGDSEGEFRLPTEAEWEYACRAGSTTLYCFGDDPSQLDEYGWHQDNAPGRKAHPVGRKWPNAWGLYDMHGNVDEYCLDWYKDTYNTESSLDAFLRCNPGGARVIRGGSVSAWTTGCRSTWRVGINQRYSGDHYGFRVARTTGEWDPSILNEATPQLLANAIYQVRPGAEFRLNLLPENAQHWVGRLRFTVTSTVPAGATFNMQTGEFAWQAPADHKDGKYYVAVAAEGLDGDVVQTSFTIDVKTASSLASSANEDATLSADRDRPRARSGARTTASDDQAADDPEPDVPLELQPIPLQIIEAGTEFTYQVMLENAAQWAGRVTFRLEKDAPRGATISPQGAFSWTPDENHATGVRQVGILVMSDWGHRTATSMSLKVMPQGFQIPTVDIREVTIDLGDKVQFHMVRIPTGQFMMGSDASEEEGMPDERPRHPVNITRPFCLGKYEVMQHQWQAIMGSNPSHFQQANCPVEKVSWEDCQEFLKKLNERYADPKHVFRLPTEAEWEHACRAGTATRFGFGDNPLLLPKHAWFGENADGQTHPVGLKEPNEWGLHDMHGNVSEWTADRYDRSSYGYSLRVDPKLPQPGAYRVVRGGSWSLPAWPCRSAARGWLKPIVRYNHLGVRVALAPAE